MKKNNIGRPLMASTFHEGGWLGVERREGRGEKPETRGATQCEKGEGSKVVAGDTRDEVHIIIERTAEMDCPSG